jgi:thiamine biosynthesis lipoprotein
LAGASQGAFDITWAALRGLWSFDPTKPKIPTDAALATALGKVDYRRLLIDPKAKTAFLRDPGMAIGLGAIAKGYGVDRALGALKSAGIAHAIVDGGGDLAVMGHPAPHRSWTVGVQHPRGGPLLATLPLQAGAVVTSGDYERSFLLDGTRYHHLLDLRTGRPAQVSVAVTVRASEATLADALATAAFVLGPERAFSFIARYPNVELALLTPDGRVMTTPGFRALFPRRWDGR